MKTFVFLACFVVPAVGFGQGSGASVLPASWSGAVFVQRGETFAVGLDKLGAVRVLPRVSLDVDALVGYDVSASAGAIGGALMLPWALSSQVTVGVGLGAKFDLSKGFSLTDLSMNSVGFVASLQVKF